jgi:hypothetical protein
MRERPIIMSAPAVRAILAGTKTQTRRVVKIKNLDFVGGGPRDGADWNDPSCWGFEDCNTGRNWALASGDDVDDIFACPYGVPGDRLWVRETHLIVGGKDSADPRVVYRASNDGPDAWISPSWAPSIHMPRWASRLTLEITGVRVERLQNISEADAMAEGASPVLVPPDGGDQPHVVGYCDLWESINGPGSWDANPWVWVVAFRRVA